MTAVNPEELINLTPDQLFERAGKHFIAAFDGDKDKVEQAMTFLIAADLNIGNALRNHLISIIQSDLIDLDKAAKIIDDFLQRNPPPSDEDAVKLMIDPENLNEEDSRKAALYLLQQPDLRPLFAEIILGLIPDIRVNLVTQVLNAPIGVREQLEVPTGVNDQITDAVTTELPAQED